jgi:hypothetical protein
LTLFLLLFLLFIALTQFLLLLLLLIALTMAELTGRAVRFERSRDAIHHYRLDNSERQRLLGPCKIPWRQGLRDMIASRHPELRLPSSDV